MTLKQFTVILLQQKPKVNYLKLNYQLCWGSGPAFTTGSLCSPTEQLHVSLCLLTTKIALIFSCFIRNSLQGSLNMRDPWLWSPCSPPIPRHSTPELQPFSGMGCSTWQLGFLAAGAFVLIHKTLRSQMLLGCYLKSPYLYSSLQTALEINTLCVLNS